MKRNIFVLSALYTSIDLYSRLRGLKIDYEVFNSLGFIEVSNIGLFDEGEVARKLFKLLEFKLPQKISVNNFALSNPKGKTSEIRPQYS